MTHKKQKSYDKLSPADQIAVDSMIQKAKKEEFEEVYRQFKSREALDKRGMNAGEIIGLIIILSLIAVVIFIPLFQVDNLRTAIQKLGPDVCAHHNSTYQGTEFRFHVQINCKDLQIYLP